LEIIAETRKGLRAEGWKYETGSRKIRKSSDSWLPTENFSASPPFRVSAIGLRDFALNPLPELVSGAARGHEWRDVVLAETQTQRLRAAHH
jgi:hypothetical protein